MVDNNHNKENKGNDNYKGIIVVIIIATAPILTYLYTYFTESGMLHYYGITSRFVNLEFHIFAMTWRFLILFFLAYIIWIIMRHFDKFPFTKKQKKKSNIYFWISFVISILFPFIAFYKQCNLLIVLLIYIGLFAFDLFVCYKLKEYEPYRLILISIIILIIVLGGGHISYEYGKFAMEKRENYYILDSYQELVVLIENNNSLICSKFDIQTKILDSSFIIINISCDTTTKMHMEKIGPLRPPETITEQFSPFSSWFRLF